MIVAYRQRFMSSTAADTDRQTDGQTDARNCGLQTAQRRVINDRSRRPADAFRPLSLSLSLWVDKTGVYLVRDTAQFEAEMTWNWRYKRVEIQKG